MSGRTRWLILVSVGAAAAFLRPFRVEVAGSSMEPTLRPGDWLIATRAGAIGRGRVVVLRHPEDSMDLVKRVSAIPGDVVDGRTLGPDEYLVEGDNSDASTDGRSFGTVARVAIEGVVRVRYSPRFGVVR
ncbi:MAG: S26 family signal peptidase [Actinomycetota bacterium]